MQPDGSVIPCNKKSELLVLHILDELPSHAHQEEPESLSFEHTVLVIDGMWIINELISTAYPKTCKELAEVFIIVIKARSRYNESCRLVFENYAKPNHLKDLMIHGHNQMKQSCDKFHVVDSTPFQNPKVFIGNNKTRDVLTQMEADNIPFYCKYKEKVYIHV